MVTKVKMSQVATIVMGQSPPGKTYNQSGIGIPLLNGPREFGTHNPETTMWTSDPKRFCKPLDLLLCIRGSTGKMNWADKEYCIGRGISAIRGKSYEDTRFIYYSLIINLKRLLNYSEGSVLTGLSKENIENFEIAWYDEPTRKFIAETLGTLDDKIELNYQHIRTLQDTADALFKLWFVDFEFPDVADKPYKSSGGEMITSELGGIPKGWTVKNFGKLADAKRGFSYKGEEKFDLDGDYVFITLNNVAQGGGFKPEFSWITSDRLKERHFLKETDLIIANTHFGVGGANVGRLLGCPAIVYFPSNYKKEVGVFSHHTTKIIPFNNEMRYFLYLFLKSIHEETASTYRTGTSVAGLDTDNFMKNRLIVEPSKPILEKFNSIIKPLFERVAFESKEISTLEKIRDTLLPKLMSGKIRVPIEAR